MERPLRLTANDVRRQRAGHRAELYKRINALSRHAMDLAADAANAAYLDYSVEDAEKPTEFALAELHAHEAMMTTHLKLIAEDIQRLCTIVAAKPKHGE